MSGAKFRWREQAILCSLLIVGLALLLFPLYLAFVGATHGMERLQRLPPPLFFGSQLRQNMMELAGEGSRVMSTSLARLVGNSLIVALGVGGGKVASSMLAAFALTFFRFPFRRVAFWLILLTLMLPIESRLFSSYRLLSQLGLLNSYAGMILPLISSATGTFFLCQYLKSIPNEIGEAARIDGAGPITFLSNVLLPMSQTAMACLFVLMFIYGWNQYLWPLLITTKGEFYTLFIGVKQLMADDGGEAQWQLILLLSGLALLPPLLLLLALQKSFLEFFIDGGK